MTWSNVPANIDLVVAVVVACRAGLGGCRSGKHMNT